jgi:hypothetical protein
MAFSKGEEIANICTRPKATVPLEENCIQKHGKQLNKARTLYNKRLTEMQIYLT